MEDDFRRYNKFLATMCSLVPGAGHMYLGLMRKGLQFMFVFFGIIILTDLFYSARSLTVLNFIVWFYAFFDSYHTRKKLESGIEVQTDLFTELQIYDIKAKYIGIGALTIGILLLIQQSLREFLALGILIIPHNIRFAIMDSIFPIILILAGFIILKKSRLIRENKDGE